MTTKANLLSTLVVCMSLFLTSCAIDGSDSSEPDTKGKYPSIEPTEAVLKSFDVKYPNAKNVEWSTEGIYYVADFTEFSSTINSWFEQEGDWVLAKSTLSSGEVLKSVSEAFAKSAYANYQVKNQSKLERRDFENLYIVEAQNTAQNVNLYYSANGDYIKTVKNLGYIIDTPIEVPEEINSLVVSLFSSPKILDIWSDQLGPKVGVMENNVYKMVALDSGYDWISTIWAISEQSVPDVVMNSFKSSSYGSNELESIRMMESIERLAYLFYFSEDEKHKIATLQESGNIVSVLSY